MNRTGILLRLTPLLLIGAFTACNFPVQDVATTPTLNVTEAYQTVQARLTEVVALTPTQAQSPSPEGDGTPAATSTPAPSQTASQLPASPTLTVTRPCDQAAAGNPIDVTIPDDTHLQPGQSFTKIWRLRNVGTCSWSREYAAVWFSGEMLSAPSRVPMPDLVDPGEAVEISVDMIAPAGSGSFQSNWKLSNAAGVLFGIGPGGDSPFWVRIVVDAPPTETAAPSPQPSLTPTASATPNVLVEGNRTLIPSDRIDLDTLQLNLGDGEDLLYQINESNNALLTPQAGALLGVFGNREPTLLACQGASLSNASLPVESLSTGTYLCYLTALNHYGWARLVSLDQGTFQLNMALLTWGPSE